MSSDEQRIREALALPEAPDPARFSAEVLFRLGRRRRALRTIARAATAAGLAAPVAVLAPTAFASLSASTDLPALAAGLMLLLLCAIAAPLRA